MKKIILREDEKYTVTHHWKKRWYRVTACLAAAVVFCTTYAMILPAVTASLYPPLIDDGAYVENISVTEIVDGTEVWDDDNSSGNDDGPNNKIVRSFDTVKYKFTVDMRPHNSGDSYGEARVKLEFVLPLTEEEAVFDTSAMGWMDQTSGYTPSLKTENRTINNNEVSCQVLTCYRHLTPTGDNNTVIPGGFANDVTVNVKAAKNDTKINPQFSACMEYGKWDGTCDVHKIYEKKTTTTETVTVSAAPKYNIQIAGTTSYKDTFNFNSGKDTALNRDKGMVPGRIFRLGITLQVYNDNPAKHFKGVELPDGSDITFDLKLKSTYNGDKEANVDVTKTYTPLIWSVDANAWTEYNGTNADGRVLKDIESCSAYEYAPWNGHDYPDSYDEKSCLDGGEWSAVQIGETVNVTVKNYKVDLDKIPTKNAIATDVKYGEDLGIGYFSSGEFWVVQPFNLIGSTSDTYDIITAYGDGSFVTDVDVINNVY